jgi:hypothetical protein
MATHPGKKKKIEVTEFLELNIDGFLVHDLEFMMRKEARIGFPLLMTVISAIELLGGLLSDRKFKMAGKSEKNFVAYWEKYLYPRDAEKRALGSHFYCRVRHSIAHGFLVTGGIAVSTDKPDSHLTIDEAGKVTIDAVRLAEDFLSSYRDSVKPLLTAGNKSSELANIKLRLGDLADGLDANSRDYPLDIKTITPAQAPAPDSVTTGAPVLEPTSSSKPIVRVHPAVSSSILPTRSP